MVCIEKRPHKMRGRSLAPNFIYLTCLLDRGHITVRQPLFIKTSYLLQSIFQHFFRIIPPLLVCIVVKYHADTFLITLFSN